VVLRERAGAVVEGPTSFVDGDRLRLELTCPPGQEASWEVVALQADKVHFPLPGGGHQPCGNRIALPGALRVDGPVPVTLCVLLAEPGGGARRLREALERSGRAALPPDALCHTLRPTP